MLSEGASRYLHRLLRKQFQMTHQRLSDWHAADRTCSRPQAGQCVSFPSKAKLVFFFPKEFDLDVVCGHDTGTMMTQAYEEPSHEVGLIVGVGVLEGLFLRQGRLGFPVLWSPESVSRCSVGVHRTSVGAVPLHLQSCIVD